jgi:hypothetical protein
MADMSVFGFSARWWSGSYVSPLQGWVGIGGKTQGDALGWYVDGLSALKMSDQVYMESNVLSTNPNARQYILWGSQRE